MKISTSTFGVVRMYGLKDGLEILANAGFEAIDYSLTQSSMDWEEALFLDASSPSFAEYFRKTAKIVRDSGLEMYQCHAPYASVTISDPDFYAHLQKQIIRSIYAAGYMECPNIVAHPVLHKDFCNGQNKALARQTTIEHFSAMVPALRETGVTMCIENLLFWPSEDHPLMRNACSEGEELRYIIDTLNDMHGPLFAACVDTGHAIAVRQDPAEMLKILGHRTRVLHLQDNLGVWDDHLIPSMGIIDWKSVAIALGEIGYKGTFNFEVTKHFTNLPRDIYSQEAFQQACNLLYAIGRSLVDIAEDNCCSK